MKTLTLVGAHNLRPELNELRRMEAADEYPRASYFNTELNTELMDERYLMRAPTYRRSFYKQIPIPAAQISEAFIVRSQYDAVISWNEKVGIPFAGLMKARGGRRVPHVAIFSWISKPKTSRLLRATQSHFDTIMLMSSHQRSIAINRIGIPESKLPLLRWPVDTNFWRPLKQTSDMICAVGREMRDYDTLIAAVAGTEIPLHIAANVVPGKNDPWIRTINDAQERYPNIRAGKKSFRELRELYARSRFLVMPVLPTDTDNGSTSILEAMAMGKTVICSRTAGQIDIIENGKTGLFVPTNDPRAMREAIEYLWNNPDVAERMGRAAYDHVVKHHRLEDWVARVKAIVQEAITKH